MAEIASTFQQAMRLSWLRGISSVSGSPVRTLRSWIMEDTYSFQTPPGRSMFDLFVPDVAPLIEAYASDANRMSCSAFETIVSIAAIPELRRSLAWLAIKCYYAAFYSAHAFLRLQGISCTQLDSSEVIRIASVAQAYGFGGSRISAGFHSVSFSPDRRSLAFRNAGKDGGGSHEALWFEFEKALAKVEDVITASPLLADERLPVLTKLNDLRKILFNAGCRRANWLSKIRNEINYRHAHGVWFPHRSSNNINRYLDLIRTSLSIDPSQNELDEDETLESFVKVCLFIVNVTRCTVIDMAKSHPTGDSFQSAGPMIVLQRGRLARSA